MSTPTSLSDTLPSSIPKLNPTGQNWAIFTVRFQDAVEAKGFWSHFDGSKEHPKVVDEKKPTDDELAAITKWDKDELSAKSLLTQKIPNSTLMRVHSKKTVRARWKQSKRSTQRRALVRRPTCMRVMPVVCIRAFANTVVAAMP